jgi:hypothetical protein
MNHGRTIYLIRADEIVVGGRGGVKRKKISCTNWITARGTAP